MESIINRTGGFVGRLTGSVFGSKKKHRKKAQKK
jgi:hypothetical protein